MGKPNELKDFLPLERFEPETTWICLKFQVDDSIIIAFFLQMTNTQHFANTRNGKQGVWIEMPHRQPAKLQVLHFMGHLSLWRTIPNLGRTRGSCIQIRLRGGARHRFSAFWLRSKCSICSYQLNIWYVPHRGTTILNWFLELGEVSGACSAFATGWPGIAVPPGPAHSLRGLYTMKILQEFALN